MNQPDIRSRGLDKTQKAQGAANETEIAIAADPNPDAPGTLSLSSYTARTAL